MVKYYRNIWIVSLMILYLVLFIYKIVKGVFLEDLILFHFMFSGIMLMVLSNKKISALMKYLKENYTEKWEFLNTYPIFGRGFVNSYRVFKFVSSKDDFEDQNLKELKEELVKFKKFSFIVLFSPIFGIIASNL